VRLCVICDGAEWIWKHVQTLFPGACQVLDYYHCSEYLHKMAKSQQFPLYRKDPIGPMLEGSIGGT
jgi:hypothetical protein